jgi:hypothetical protein
MHFNSIQNTRNDAHAMFWCIVTRSNTEGVTITNYYNYSQQVYPRDLILSFILSNMPICHTSMLYMLDLVHLFYMIYILFLI